MRIFETDTIAAIATPPGHGGIGIVRISGPDSLTVLQRLFRSSPRSGFLERVAFRFQSRRLHHGWVYAPPEMPGGQEEALDEVLAVYMPGPGTATGEDTGEIHCHGGSAILRAVLDAAVQAGARLAERGEFTYRAFANGRMDLTQAEAVAEMIAAPSRQGLRLAKAKLEGLLGRRITDLRALVEELRARVCLAVDFPEEEGECLDLPVFSASLQSVHQGITGLLAGYERARQWREGALAVLAGRVNVGKSSLLNALLGRERAIVSAEPGTTRDFIEETLDLDGLRVRLTDTAGLRESSDKVEQAGVRLARDLARDADCILLVVEAGIPLTEEERGLIAELGSKLLLVWNKIDAADPDAKRAVISYGQESIPSVAVSAKNGEGLELLAQTLRGRILAAAGADAPEPAAGDLAPNLRQSQLLRAALEQTDSLALDLKQAVPCDLLGVGLDTLASLLSDITGESTPDAILGQVFSRFCIGK